ncbi:hypothetical protein FOL47_003807 [Perkinsus chesapeaki]|uniref:RING-type domain-containing protein n=1 Tax=Perkinsus chesapeaki TaxID=330153 RepID=A0A7J6M669_PERCH|nr:hypothetical protein FOL47_003807 [Perkinsus chesapeaki]
MGGSGSLDRSSGQNFRPGAKVIVLAGHPAAGMTDLDFTGETVFVPKAMVETESPIDAFYFANTSGSMTEPGGRTVTTASSVAPAVGDRVEIIGDHDKKGKRGFVTEAASVGPEDTLYTIALDDGSVTCAGQEYIIMAMDGATRAGKAERGETGIDEHLLVALKNMGRTKEWGQARTTLASLKPTLDDTTAECALCCEDLCDSPTAVLVKADPSCEDGDRKVRVCRHYYHVSCLRDMFLTKSLERRCPLCREEFQHYVPLPDLKREPELWFKVVDSRGDGHLTLEEAVAAAQSILPVSQYGLTDLLKKDGSKLWRKWAKSNGETITLGDFFEQDGGFYIWLLANLRELHRLHQNGRKLPDLFSAGGDCDIENAWFDYWDFTGTGVLTKQQLERALAISVVANTAARSPVVNGESRPRPRVSSSMAENRMGLEVGEVVEALWDDIDPTHDGLIMRNAFHGASRLLLPNLTTLGCGGGAVEGKD